MNFFQKGLAKCKTMCYNTRCAQGYSSVGRVLVSKTKGRGFESFCPCHHYRSKKIRPRKQEKTGDFERFLPFFRAYFFSKFHRSIFGISSSRKERTMDWAVFSKLTVKNKRPKGLEPTTGFQILSFFCFRHKLFTNQPLQNQSIPSSKGSEPTKSWKTHFSKTVHCSIGRIWTHEYQILTCWRQRKSLLHT